MTGMRAKPSDSLLPPPYEWNGLQVRDWNGARVIKDSGVWVSVQVAEDGTLLSFPVPGLSFPPYKPPFWNDTEEAVQG